MFVGPNVLYHIITYMGRQETQEVEGYRAATRLWSLCCGWVGRAKLSGNWALFALPL